MSANQANALVVVDEGSLKQELGLLDPGQLTVQEDADPVLDKQAADFVQAIMAYDPNDPAKAEERLANVAAVETLGSKTQQEAAKRSGMLKQPIKKLAARGEDGGEVAKALVDLKLHVEELDPARFDFEAGWLSRALGFIPGVGTPLKRYFTRFESAETVIEAVVKSLELGRETLKRDNITLGQDQKHMRNMTFKLQKVIQLGMLIDQKLVYALEREITDEDPRRRFVEDELVFPLRQRIQDLQQQLAVNQQGVLAIELIIRNNKELIKGVDRGINVTVNALNVAVTVALALANQKIVLDKINALTATTDRLIAQTAATLRQQGAEIHKQASSTQLDMDTLKKAFEDINGALDDISRFRKEALPLMANNIVQMDELTKETEESIQRMEQGNQAAQTIMLDVELDT